MGLGFELGQVGGLGLGLELDHFPTVIINFGNISDCGTISLLWTESANFSNVKCAESVVMRHNNMSSLLLPILRGEIILEPIKYKLNSTPH